MQVAALSALRTLSFYFCWEKTFKVSPTHILHTSNTTDRWEKIQQMKRERKKERKKEMYFQSNYVGYTNQCNFFCKHVSYAWQLWSKIRIEKRKRKA